MKNNTNKLNDMPFEDWNISVDTVKFIMLLANLKARWTRTTVKINPIVITR